MNSKNTFNKETMKERQKKKQFAQLATAAMIASVVAPAVTDVLDMEEKTAHAAGEYTSVFAGGDGTEANPYLISNAEELNQIRNVTDTSGVYFKLTQNITMPESNWTPLPNFAGHFDGGEFEIDGLYINLPTTKNVGLFGQTKNGSTISNIGLTNVNVTGGDDTGGLVGNSSSTISNAYATGSVTGGNYTGGLVGSTSSTSSSSISNVYATANVTGGYSVGGLVGWSQSSLTNAYATGSVTGGNNVGGLVGWSQSSLTNAYATGNVTGDQRTGGLVGFSASSLTNAYATGNVTGTNNTGGLVGSTSSTSSSISKAYATGNVTGTNNTGGLVGTSGSSITNAYATGNVTGDQHVGGSVGNLSSSITNVYATGNVTGKNNIGGLVGYASSTGPTYEIINSYAFNSSVVSDQEYFGAGQVHRSVRVDDKSAFAWEGMIGIGDAFHRKISTENALKAETYLNNNWDMEGGSNTPVWAIDEGKDLPYLIDLGPTKSGPWDSTPGNWYTTFNDVNKEKVSLEIATKAVIRAERTRIKPDFNAAQNSVYGLKLSAERDDLQDRLDALKTLMKAEEHLWTDAQDAIDKARENPTEENINDAQDKINKLPESIEKDDLQNQLDKIIKDKEDQLNEAEEAVSKAEDTLKQDDFDVAQDLVNQLPEGQDKQDLQDRLDNIKDKIKGEDGEDGGTPTEPTEPTESDEDKALRLATEAVEKVEETLNLDDFNVAQDLVNQLPDGPEKQDLQDRLDTVIDLIIEKIKNDIDDMKDKDLDELDKDDLLDKLEDLNKVPDGKEVEDLKDDIDDLLEQLGEHEKQKGELSEAERLVVLAERYERDPYIQNAQNAVDKLSPSDKKDELQARLDALRDKIANAEVDKIIRAAEQAVRYAENYKREPYFTRAQDAINKIPEDHPKRKELQDRLDALLQAVEEAEKQKVLDDVERLVELAEKTPTDRNINNAQKGIDTLEESDFKQSLQDRLDAVRDNIFYEKAKSAVDNVEKYPNGRNVVERAQDAIDLVPERHPGKQELQNRLDALQGDKLSDDAKKLVEQAERYPTSKNDFNKAQDAVNKLPDDHKDKQELQDRLDALAQQQNKEEQKKEHLQTLKDAEQAVSSAERNKKEPYLTNAQDTIDAIQEGLFDEEKQALQDRLDKVKKDILQKQIDDALEAIAIYDESGRDTYKKRAQNKINEVDDEEERKKLQDMLDGLDGMTEKEIHEAINAAELGVQLAVARKTDYVIQKAQEHVNRIPDSHPKKEELQAILDSIPAMMEAEMLEDNIRKAENLLNMAESRKTDTTINNAAEAIEILPNGPEKEAFEARLQVLLDEQKLMSDPIIKDATIKLERAERLLRNPYFAQAREAIKKIDDDELREAYHERLDIARMSIFEDLHIKNLERKAEKRVLFAEHQLTEGYFLVAKYTLNELHEVNKDKYYELEERLNAAIAKGKTTSGEGPIEDLLVKQLNAEISSNSSKVYKEFVKAMAAVTEAEKSGKYFDILEAIYQVDALVDVHGKMYYDLTDSLIIYADSVMKTYQVNNV